MIIDFYYMFERTKLTMKMIMDFYYLFERTKISKQNDYGFLLYV